MDNERLANLNWVAMAMTVPENTQERYYYDALTQQFFYSRPLRDAPNRFELFDDIDLHLIDEEYDDIINRLEGLNDGINNIIEIPRLNVSEKVDIQLQFLSHFDGVYHLRDLISAVENQKDDYKMVLDTVLIENSNSAPMVQYWKEFKLKTVYNYIKVYTNAVGIEINID